MKRNQADQDPDAAALREFQILVDCLALFYQTGDETFRQIFVGEVLKILHLPSSDRESRRAQQEKYCPAIIASIWHGCCEDVPADSRQRLEHDLDYLRDVVLHPIRKTVDLVMIGDCYFLDVVLFLAGACREHGIELNTTFVGSYNPDEQRRHIGELAESEYTAVCYSPFTYTLAVNYSRSHTACALAPSGRALQSLVEPDLAMIEGHLDQLARLFDCPIIVHNSINIRRHNGGPADFLKKSLSLPTRAACRLQANDRLAQALERLNKETFRHFFLFDEHRYLRAHSEWELGRRFYDSEVQHPTVLSRLVAHDYRELVLTLVDLMSKKLVVCDLDNTLWEGEIGEGAVRHFHDRQQILRKLRQKGVLLAINSKNDPANVHWRDAVLDENDFIAAQINWDPKPLNMRRIQQKLNLKSKDFVFVDDRPDQRELVSAEFPEIYTIDATSERHWKRLALWSELIADSDTDDRTELYRQRAEREKFIESPADSSDQGETMRRLGLQASIRAARKSDLNRIVELINRTNQFNLNATRTKYREALAWFSAPRKWIMIVEGSDKFGPMGIICVAYLEQCGSTFQIPVFVLSCRVFGYGFETALLEAIADFARASRAEGDRGSIVGFYQETPLNGPCRSMYPSSGFVWRDGAWAHEGDNPIHHPEWLSVTANLPNAARDAVPAAPKRF